MTVTQLPKRHKVVPKLYEEDASKYAGPHPFQQSFVARQARKWLKDYAYLQWAEPFTEIEVTGLDHLDHFSGPAIFVGNHTSHLDTILTQSALPDRIADNLFYGAAQDRWFVKGKKKKELHPLYQSFVLGTFPILRGGGLGALSYASELVANGHNIFLFPEGTRAMDGELGEFKHGATILALRHRVPVVPLYLGGLRAIRPKGSRDAVPGKVSLDILKPIVFDNGTDVETATSLVRAQMNLAHKQRHPEPVRLDRSTDDSERAA